LIFGPSGAGKSSFGKWLATEQNWIHLEIDRYPLPEDGIDANELRHEWDEFYCRKNARLLGDALRQRFRAHSNASVALTFPGTFVLSREHMVAATDTGVRTVYLYGSAAHCVAAFLNREQHTGRNLDLNHWIAHNCVSYNQLTSDPAFGPYKIDVFTRAGIRRRHADVFEALLTR